ncbi:flagellar biosynthetic protein FliO [Nitrosospira sp. NRS527]|uniref:flagellar biosynthetic protein FliO n=1 Tax=Nitrosospira sp. NRS527 TaxID=155925 RepID=UPI001FD124CD|nr:flagellar biosynthetic protein FliO [Nitrosospira sp. NRS527]
MDEMKTGGIRNSIFAHFHGKCACFINSPYRVDLARHPKGFSAGPIPFLAPLSLILWTLPVTTMAQTVATDTTGAASGGSMLQVILGLGLVLAVMAGSAWLLRRFGGLQRRPGGGIKVIGSSAVGQRERVVLVEVADTWLVIGVAPGHVTALHSMPKGEITTGTADIVGGASTDHHFSAWFRQVTAKRDGEQHGK